MHHSIFWRTKLLSNHNSLSINLQLVKAGSSISVLVLESAEEIKLDEKMSQKMIKNKNKINKRCTIKHVLILPC